MIAFGDFESNSKMMIYKIHQLRILAVATLLIVIAVLLLLLNPPQKCIQVSMSVRHWQSHPIKRTRVVQSLDESIATSETKYIAPAAVSKDISRSISDAWFRTKIILPFKEKDADEEEELEDEAADEAADEVDDEDDSETNENYGAEEYYGDLPENRVFEDGDFDYNDTDRYGSKFLEPDFGIILRIFNTFRNNSSNFSMAVPPTHSSQFNKSLQVLPKNHRKSLRYRWRNITLINIEGVPIVEDGIFWSDELERRAPRGASDEEVQSVLKKLRSLNVQRVEQPTWNRCGRPKNQFVVFEDGSKACARYRAPHQYLVQGEVLSFYLSRLLGINNVPVVSLAAVRPDFQGMWSRQSVKEDLIASKWEVNTTVALIQWIENLERDKMPRTLLSCLENKEPLSAKSSAILKLSTKQLTELLQWSDLIVFDYITGNYDRVASMQDAADKENKPSILRETVHNLVRSKTTGGLWLIDNESGLLDSYSLLYGATGKDGRFLNFHRQILGAICLFRRHTVERIRWLYTSGQAGAILMELVKELEPLFTPVKREKEVSKRLQQRIAEVYEHVEWCSSILS